MIWMTALQEGNQSQSTSKFMPKPRTTTAIRHSVKAISLPPVSGRCLSDFLPMTMVLQRSLKCWMGFTSVMPSTRQIE